MKAPTTAAKSARAAARNAALMNLLATPGLGTLMARRWLTGVVQLAIFLAGFVLFLLWFGQDLHSISAALRGDDVPDSGAAARYLRPALALTIGSWIWAAFTSRDILRQVTKTEAPAASVAPPKLAVQPAPVRGWDLAGQTLSRTFEFADFAEAMRFVNAVAARAEEVQHHPDIDLRWNKVTLALTSHDVGHLTERDINLAVDCNELFDTGA
jgi:4a-hydroxytetrahydrobiopterin dehydratase